ncbi:MAG TPA: DUF2299 family protein [Nitrososphaeraceae archaeon]|jgi:hypothetical protein|nr:DUF2299 family protein [Nitrososphaeraceae archaeon]
MNNELDLKEVTFNNIIQGLSDIGFIIEKKEENKNPESKIQFELLLSTGRGYRFPFRITFTNILKDVFVISSNISLNEEDAKSIQSMKKRDREQIFMDLRKLVFPLHVNIETPFPRIFLYKEITFDSISTNKQFLIDEVYNFRNAMELVKIRFDELYYSFYPEGSRTDYSN